MEGQLGLPDLPLVGREELQQTLLGGLDSALRGKGRTFLLTGERGIGKTHLCLFLEAEAQKRAFRTASGRAYLPESGVPYALLADALVPLLRTEAAETLDVLTRGGASELGYLLPGLATPGFNDGRQEIEASGEVRARLLWSLTELIRGLALRQPLYVVLEDLQWADPSSLEVTHTLARQLVDCPAVLVLTRDEPPPEGNRELEEMEGSLLSQGLAQEVHLPPLTLEETRDLILKGFGVPDGVAAEFIDQLHRWTQGNPFFLEETLKSLVRSGSLYRKGGQWMGWEVQELGLPATVREGVVMGLRDLPQGARTVAELAAILGTRAPFQLLQVLTPLTQSQLLESLEVLVSREVLTETLGDDDVVYDFRQTLVRETLLREIGLARTRILHGRVAEGLEEIVAEEGARYSGLLAYHYLEAGGPGTPAAILRLAAAGREALTRFGNAEAARYLEAALNHMDRSVPWRESLPPDREDRLGVVKDLARALTGLGRLDEAVQRWEQLSHLAEEDGDLDGVAASRLQIALIHNARGESSRALEELENILTSASSLHSRAMHARIRLHRAIILAELGRAGEARSELEGLLGLSPDEIESDTVADAHRALANLYIWTGEPDQVTRHAEEARELALRTGDRSIEFWSHWSQAVLAGLLGDTASMAERVKETDRIAKEIRSPPLRLRSLELEIELASATGEWERGLILGEQAISLGRAFSQGTVLPRVLVWTALIYLGRGDLELARPLIHEAWDSSGAGGKQPANIHGVIPAYIGKGHLAMAEGNFQEAIRVGRAGLALAEKTGYGLWTLHRLIPLLAEACLWSGDLDGAREMGALLRRSSGPIGHRLGIALAESCEALVTWLEGDSLRGSELMAEAAEALDAIPMVGEATRVRRLRAGRLAELGDRRGALEELTRVHEVFLRLGAEVELAKTRTMFRELGARPPRKVQAGDAELSPRELEIAMLVEERRSNKAIARVLGISPRTVGTHLSNIYQKLGIGSRGELVDYLREERLG